MFYHRQQRLSILHLFLKVIGVHLIPVLVLRVGLLQTRYLCPYVGKDIVTVPRLDRVHNKVTGS
jgi:hypothetical protein